MANSTTDPPEHQDLAEDASISEEWGHRRRHVKNDVVVVGLVRKTPVVQEHILQTLAAFRFMCYTNRRALQHIRWDCAKATSCDGGMPSVPEASVVGSAEEKAVSMRMTCQVNGDTRQ